MIQIYSSHFDIISICPHDIGEAKSVTGLAFINSLSPPSSWQPSGKDFFNEEKCECYDKFFVIYREFIWKFRVQLPYFI